MERLTYKTQDGWVGIKEQEDKTVSPTSLAIHKLCELEDVLEEYNIQDAQDLDRYLNFKTNVVIWEGRAELEHKIKDLKQALSEFKQKAIIPKFSVGQEIWYIFGNEIRSMVVSTIEATKNLICYHNFKGDVSQWESNCFSTKEEAEQKLAEIGGKDE